MKTGNRVLLASAAGLLGALALSRMVRGRRAVSFAGRVVVITGGSRGLGLEIARQLAAEGARLCLLARDEGELDRAREELVAAGGEVLTISCDIRRRADVRAAIDTVLERWPAIDVLINNAGVIQVGPLEHMTTADFENAMATHFWGPLHLMFEAVPSMRQRRFGRIVNIASIGGRMAVPHLAPYSASKFALVGLSDAVRTELEPYGIRVTTVSPGPLRTGSPVNVTVKGQHASEYAWFLMADSLPGISTAAERAARQIVDACRHGDPELTISLPARAAMVANTVAPALLARAMRLVNRLLPGPGGAAGAIRKVGRQAASDLAPPSVTVLTDRAAVVNNET